MIRPRVPIVVALLLVVAGSAAVVGAQEDLSTLTVSVTTPGGTPVRDATLTATWDGGSTTRTTAANGKAFVDVPTGADVAIDVDHRDYVRNAPLTVENATTRDVSMTVYRKASLSLTVRDGDGPVSNAAVTLRKGSGNPIVRNETDDGGTVDSGTIEAGTYTVVVHKAGYFVHQQTLEIDGDAATTVSIRRGTVTLQVNVTDDHFDPPQPVAGASVAVEESGSVTTQPGGVGRISVPVNTWLSITVSKDGYRSTDLSHFVAEDDADLNVSIQRVPAISVDLLSQRVVTGEHVSLTVTDEYGDPVPNATVSLDGESAGETDARGQAVAAVSSDGNHTIAVTSGSLQATATVVGVGEGGTTRTTATPGPTPSDGTETSPGLPGFGVLVALLAVLVAVASRLVSRP